jgi:hypothetical protein
MSRIFEDVGEMMIGFTESLESSIARMVNKLIKEGFKFLCV